MKYPFESFTRVTLTETITLIDAPTLAELNAGTLITYELTPDGLRLPRATESVDSTTWNSRLSTTRPVRYGMDGAALIGFRSTDDEPLWDLAVFNVQMWLVVRRGVNCDTAWAAGDVVEVTKFRFGQRVTADPASDVLTTFTVPLFVMDDRDSSVVA